jgi:hypothetical protein
MPKCPICGKEIKNPNSPSHINSKFHQVMLKKQQEPSMKHKGESKELETQIQTKQKEDNNTKSLAKKLKNKFLDDDGYLKITELESNEIKPNFNDEEITQFLISMDYKIRFSDFYEFLFIINTLFNFLSFKEIIEKIDQFPQHKLKRIIKENIFDIDQEYFNTIIYGFDLCVNLISKYLEDKALIKFLDLFEDLEDIISKSYYEEVEAPSNPTLIKIEHVLSKTLKGKSQKQYDKALSIINNSGLFFEHLKKKLLNTFRINEYITLKLVGNRTNIYVKNQLFNQCKYLLLNIPKRSIPALRNIESIDEAAEKLDRSMEGHEGRSMRISPETEFWGHCSNLQAWVENNYDTRLLHRNLAFPLLLKLAQVGDPTAKKVFREEILKRINSGVPSVIQYIINQRYLRYLKTRDIDNLLENVIKGKLDYWKAKSLREVLTRFISMGSTKAREMLNELILDDLKGASPRNFQGLINQLSFKSIPQEKIEEVYNSIEKKILEIDNSELSIHIFKKFAEIPISKALTNFKKEIFKAAEQKNVKLISKLFDLNYLKDLNSQELTKLFKSLDIESIKDSFEKIIVLKQFSTKNILNSQPLLIKTIKKAVKSNDKDLIEKIITQNYLKYLKTKEVNELFDTMIKNEIFTLDDEVFGDILEIFTNLGVSKASSFLKLRIKEILKSSDIAHIKNLSNKKYLKMFSDSELSTIYEELNFDKIFRKNLSYAIKLTKRFGKKGLKNHQTIIKNQVKKLLSHPDKQTISSVLNKSVLSLFSDEEVKQIIADKDSKTIERLFQYLFSGEFKTYVIKKITRFLQQIRPFFEQKIRNIVISTLSDANLNEFCSFIKAKGLELLSNQEKELLLEKPNCFLNEFIVKYRGKEFQVNYKFQLDLGNQNITNLEEVEGLENLTLVKDLDLRNNRLERISGFGNLKNLKKLRLRGNNFPEDLIDHLGGIDRYGNAYEPQKFVNFCKILKSGELQTVKINNERIAVFDNELILKNKNISDLSDIKGLFELSNLKKLVLSKNKLKNVQGIEKLPSLRILNLSDNNLSDIRNLEKLENLEELTLYGNNIYELEYKDNFKNLKILHLDSIREIDDRTYLNCLLQSLNVKQIKEICRYYNIRGYSRYRRQALIDFTLQSLAEEEQRELISKLELPSISKNIRKAYKKIRYEDRETLEDIRVVNKDTNEIELSFKGFNWETKCFLSINSHNIDDPDRDCDCRIGSNNGLCSHFWIGFIFALKIKFFKLSDWTLTQLPENFEEQIQHIEIKSLSSGKELLLDKKSNTYFLLNNLKKKVFVHEATISDFKFRQYNWQGKTISYYLSKATNVKLSPYKNKTNIATLDNLLVRFSENMFKRFKLEEGIKIRFSGEVKKDRYLGFLLQRVFIKSVIQRDSIHKKHKIVPKGSEDSSKEPKKYINLRTIDDGLNGSWWHHIKVDNFKFVKFLAPLNKYPVSENDILIHKEIKPGERYPTTRYHIVKGDSTKIFYNFNVKQVLINKLIQYVKENEKLPPNCVISRKLKADKYKIDYNPSTHIKFSLKIIPSKYGISTTIEELFIKSKSRLVFGIEDYREETSPEHKKHSWSVESKSDPNKRYEVSLDSEGNWSCTCPHHVFRNAICKHIKEIQKKNKELIN